LNGRAAGRACDRLLSVSPRRRRSDLKTGIHPEYKETSVTCACGSTFTTRSTASNIHVEICSSCHPFFTGKQKLVDSAGRVDKFLSKYGLKKK